jgi:hypothetical protein
MPMKRSLRLDTDPRGALARWVELQSTSSSKRLAAVQVGDAPPTLFVANELLIGPGETDLIEACRRQGGEVISLPEFDLSGLRIEPRRLTLAKSIPEPIRIRFHAPVTEPDAERLLLDLAERATHQAEVVSATSEADAALAAFVLHHAKSGHEVSLNLVGRPDALALRSPQEGAPSANSSDPRAWWQFQAPYRVVDAWQLLESLRAATPLPDVRIAIVDTGFWLDGQGAPLVAVTRGETVSDLVPVVVALSTIPEGPPNLPNTLPNNDGSLSVWHGNGAASVAGAQCGNFVGAAGTGGSVSNLILIRVKEESWELIRALRFALALGAEVINISMSWTDSFFSEWSQFNAAFQIAKDAGVIITASAGNNGRRLPDYDLRPATRTPGVITVGAVDLAFTARSDSNYGISVDIWAPGTGLPIIPDGTWDSGVDPFFPTFGGTSAAAPFVAGVAAMMRVVNPDLNVDLAGQILQETGWTGSDGKVGKGVDALAAVLKALGGKLPSDQPQPGSAKGLVQVAATRAFQPFLHRPALHNTGEVHTWFFDLDEISTVSLELIWYRLLGSLTLFLETDDSSNLSLEDFVVTTVAGDGRIFGSGHLSPGRYRVRIVGSATTAYELIVTPSRFTVQPDAFEYNDSFESAKTLLFMSEPSSPLDDVPIFLNADGPGDFDLTLHAQFVPVFNQFVVNPDFFQLIVPKQVENFICSVYISGCDFPVDVALFDADHRQINAWFQIRELPISPPPDSVCFLKISEARPTRYNLQVTRFFDPRILPEEVEQAQHLPDWWKKKADFKVNREVQYLGFEVLGSAVEDPILLDPGAHEIAVDVLDLTGAVVGRSTVTADGRVHVPTADLAPGPYLLRLSRPPEVAAAGALRVRRDIPMNW